jgi:glycosyltransferase involved in cell wall biosynthesis
MAIVSVVLPVFNASQTVERAIGSILEQTLEDFQIIAINDGSSDNSLDILHRMSANDKRICVYSNEKNLGISRSLNTGISYSSSEFIARMDADDIALPNRLELQVNYLQNNPQVSILGSNLLTFGDSNMQWNLPENDSVIRTHMLFQSSIMHPTVMIRKKFFSETGLLYRDEFKEGGDDLDLWTRVPESHKFANLQINLIKYRLSKQSLSQSHFSTSQKKLRKILENYLNRNGVKFSQEEMDLHFKLANWNENWESSEVENTERWLDSLELQLKDNSNLDEDDISFSIEMKRQFLEKWKSWNRKAPENIAQETTGPVSQAQEFIRVAPSKLRDLLENEHIRTIKRYIPIFIKREAKEILYRLIRMINFGWLLAIRVTRVRLIPKLMINKALGFAIEIFKIADEEETSTKGRIKVAMGILVFERVDYLEICLESIASADNKLVDLTIYILDDGSSDPRVKQVIEKFCNSQLNGMIEVHYFPKGANNAGQAINRFLDLLKNKEKFDFLGWTDPDALFSRDWQRMFLIARDAYAKYPKMKLGPISSFNSSNVEYHQPYGRLVTDYGDVILKRQMGMLNYFYPNHLVEVLGRFSESGDDETLKTIELEKGGYKNFCTSESFVEHLGRESALQKWRPKSNVRVDYGLNLVATGWPDSLLKLDTLGALKQKGQFFSHGRGIPEPSVDVVILCHPKDSDKLLGCVQSVRKNLVHRIDKVFVVSPKNTNIETLCKSADLIFVDEESFSLDSLNAYRYSTWRSWNVGWIWQQLIKLQLDSIGESEYLYLIDVDTQIAEKVCFFHEEKIVLLKSSEWHVPYFDFIQRIFPEYQFSRSSFVTHQMFIKKAWLTEFKHDIESAHKLNWHQAILSNLDSTELNAFSEFELIGTWLLNVHPNEIVQGYWFGFQEEDQPKRRFKILSLKTKNPTAPYLFKSNHNREKWRNLS